ncbi:MAG: hypothetical protein K2Y21_07840 [Phycisphaerales bacterium]|nr:hypothetical protein [Phycisphaerales bacterium]
MPVRTTSALSLSLLLAAGAALSACDRADPAARPLAVSSGAMQRLSGGSYNAPKEKLQNDVYKGVLATAKPVMDADSKSAQGAAAAGMIGSAQLGQAQPHLFAAADAELTALSKSALIRTLIDNYTSQSLSVETSAGFDPAPLIADLEKSRAEAQKDIAQHQAKLADIERKIADLSAKADAKAAESKKLSDEFLAVRASLATLSAKEAETKLTAARETKRRGDAIRVEASRLQAQADLLKPEAQELKVLVEASKSRIAGLDRMKLEASEKAQQGQAASAQSKSAASETAKQIEEKLKELASIRTNEVISSYDAGIAALRTAVSTAKTSAGDSGSGAGKLLTGRAQLALADALSSKANSLQMYASLLGYVVNAKPALPFAANADTERKQVLELHKNTLDDAKSAFEAAESAFSGVQLRGSGTGEIKERMSKLAEKLGALAGKTPAPAESAAQPAQPEQPEQPAPAAAPEAAPAQSAATSNADDAAAGWAAIYAALESGDTNAVLAHTKLADPAHEATVRAIAELSGAQRALDAACQEKFGKTLTDVQAAAVGKSAPKSAADYKVTVEGDTATVTNDADPSPTKLIRENGKWLLDSSSLASGPAAMMAQMAEPIKKAMTSITEDVKSGKITQIESIMMELQKRMQGGG